MSPGLPRLERHHRRHPCATRPPPLLIEYGIRAPFLCGELRSHSLGRQDRATANACGLGARHSSTMHLFIRLRFEDLELDMRGLALGPRDPVP